MRSGARRSLCSRRGPGASSGSARRCGYARRIATDDLRIDERPSLRNPVMITAFRGWNDGGPGAGVAAGYPPRQWEVTRFADIDPEAFVDFQAVRPTVSLDEGMTRPIEW